MIFYDFQFSGLISFMVFGIYRKLLSFDCQRVCHSQLVAGVLVFNGQQRVYKHRDSSVAVHAELPKVMAALA